VLANSLTNKKFECGTDEAGRGCLAGPVTAAAVILPKKFENQTINDSKIISESKRIKLKEVIENKAISFGVSHVDNNKIDQINILNASIFAMHNAISKLQNVSFISVDGNRFKPFKKIPYQTVVKGDSLYLNIAAASILAKTYRDSYMNIIHEEFPMYNWNKNKGYPTKEHRDAIKKYGVSKYHRRSFKLLPNQLNFEF
jgi:ribonuclease HII